MMSRVIKLNVSGHVNDNKAYTTYIVITCSKCIINTFKTYKYIACSKPLNFDVIHWLIYVCAM